MPIYQIIECEIACDKCGEMAGFKTRSDDIVNNIPKGWNTKESIDHKIMTTNVNVINIYTTYFCPKCSAIYKQECLIKEIIE